MTCDIGVSLETAYIDHGYFRPSNQSVSVQRCPDYKFDGSGCKGGEGELCNPGLHGIFCQLCLPASGEEHRRYYVAASYTGEARCESCSHVLWQTVCYALAALATVAALVVLVKASQPPAQIVARYYACKDFMTPETSLRASTVFAGLWKVVRRKTPRTARRPVASVYEVKATAPGDNGDVPVPEDVLQYIMFRDRAREVLKRHMPQTKMKILMSFFMISTRVYEVYVLQHCNILNTHFLSQGSQAFTRC
jgi:hypothetical protein